MVISLDYKSVLFQYHCIYYGHLHGATSSRARSQKILVTFLVVRFRRKLLRYE